MPTKPKAGRTSAKTKAPTKARTTKAPRAKTPAPKARAAAKAGSASMSLAAAMSALKAAGSEATRKTYARHGAPEPMFGVSFATLGGLMKRIGVDHALAGALWRTGNFDARNLALKIVDPAKMSREDLSRWERDAQTRMISGYVAQLAAETPHAQSVLATWMAKKDAPQRCSGWRLIAVMALRDESLPDSWFSPRLAEIERTIKAAPNFERDAMNSALIAIGSRSAKLRTEAVAAAGRIGKVEVDHGDTACETPDAASYIKKTWERSASKGFESPAAQERTRESMRTRC